MDYRYLYNIEDNALHLKKIIGFIRTKIDFWSKWRYTVECIDCVLYTKLFYFISKTFRYTVSRVYIICCPIYNRKMYVTLIHCIDIIYTYTQLIEIYLVYRNLKKKENSYIHLYCCVNILSDCKCFIIAFGC